MELKYHEPLRIPGYLCNPADKLSITGAALIFQEAAWKQAELLGFAFSDNDEPRYWVLSRMTVDFLRTPRWDESVTITTWPSGTQRLYATREYVLTDEKDEPCIIGGSSWIVLNGATGRPVKPETYLGGRPILRENALEQDFSKIAPLEGGGDEWHPVFYSAIDRNQHVNNTRYVEWFVNWARGTGFDPLLDDPEGSRVVMTYNAETLLGYEYRVHGSPEEGAATVFVRKPGETDEKAAWNLRLSTIAE